MEIAWFIAAVLSLATFVLFCWAAWRTIEAFQEIRGVRRDIAVLGALLEGIAANQREQIALQKTSNEAMAELLPDGEEG